MQRPIAVLVLLTATLAACSDSGDVSGPSTGTPSPADPAEPSGESPAPALPEPGTPDAPDTSPDDPNTSPDDPNASPDDPDTSPDAPDNSAGTPDTPPSDPPGGTPDDGTDEPVAGGPSVDGSPIAEPADLYERDGYGTVDMLRVDIRTVTTGVGPCTVDEQSGCTFADVIADTDGTDELKVDIPVHFSAEDFPEDGRETNAEMRQRGQSARFAERKSFRVELKGQGVRWRGEDKLQINKHPYDSSLIRNKVAFDLMRDIPNLPSIRTQFVNLWIDDGAGPVDYGVFTHDEASGDEFLENRGWDEDSRFYKAEKFLYSGEDLDLMAIDAEGKPLDKDRFETRLEIENGKDHRALHEMVRAVNDNDRSFDSVLAEHFVEENVMTYVAVNLLLGQPDATTHNFFLYNPTGTERFYILPWDYDYALSPEEEPPGGFTAEALGERLHYGFGKVVASNFLKRLYRQPDFHETLLAKVDELRRGPLSDAAIDDLATRYTAVVTPFAERGPEQYIHKPEQAARFSEYVRTNEAGIRSGFLPMPFGLAEPRVRDGQVEFRWSPANDVTGRRTIAYDLEVASSPDFAPDSRLLLESGIADDPDRVRFSVPVERIGSGRRFYRVVARADEDPARLWQVASDRATVDGTLYVGIQEFTVP